MAQGNQQEWAEGGTGQTRVIKRPWNAEEDKSSDRQIHSLRYYSGVL
jgi:hypothetical protein